MLSMAAIERQLLLNKEISAAGNRSGLFAALQKVAGEFGFDHVTMMAMPNTNDLMISPLIIETTIPRQFLRDFDRNGFFRYCPAVPRITSSLVPQCWAIDEDVMPPGMVSMLRTANVLGGVMVPATSLSGDRFVLRFDGAGAAPGQVVLNEICMIALYAFEVYDRLRREENAAARPLTRRELEVVRWTAQGKTSAEIGQILSLSDHTINAYMNNAIRKLDCVNRTQLVAKAIRMKLIT